MFQLIVSWFASVGLWLISMISQFVILLPQLLLKPSWISQGSQWLIRSLIEDSDDTTKAVWKGWISHAKHSIRHPHPPLTRDVQVLIVLSLGIFFWSMHDPMDRFIWILEITPLIVLSMILAGYFYRYPFTKMFYWLFFIQAVVMMVGAHYSHEQVPLGQWLIKWLGFDRNHYDRIGHFVQGFVTSIFAREILLRTSTLKRGKWLIFLCACISLSGCALYEMLELWLASLNSDIAEAFLGYQGDQMDTQWDMFLGIWGSALSLLLITKWHDKQYAKLSRYLTVHPVEKD